MRNKTTVAFGFFCGFLEALLIFIFMGSEEYA
jgi:hypothetical protein